MQTNSFVGGQLNEQLPELLLQRISFCSKHSDEWRQQIKIAHGIIPKPPPLRPRFAERVQQKPNSIRNTNPINHLNNNNTKRICVCENCQFEQINGLKATGCKMPLMDNILLRANEFNTNLSGKQQQSNSKITQIFNR